MRVLVALNDVALRAKLAGLLQSRGYIPTLAEGDQREPLEIRNLGAAIVAPTSFDDKGLAFARELCADGCKVIVLTDSREVVDKVSRLLPDSHVFLARPMDEQGLVRLLVQITATQAREGTEPKRVLRFEGR